jgi:hypothetical protein
MMNSGFRKWFTYGILALVAGSIIASDLLTASG